MSVSRWRKKLRKFLRNLDPALKADPELAFALFLNHVAERRRAFATGSSGAAARTAWKRDARRIQREIIRRARNRPKRFTVTDPDILSYRFKEDYLRDELNPKFASKFIGIPQRIKNKLGAHVKLENLSFMSNPEGTLKQLRGISDVAARCIDVQLDITGDGCEDIAPFMVLSLLMKSLPRIFTRGVIGGEIGKVLQSVGLDKALGMRVSVGNPPRSLILPFKMVTRIHPRKFSDPNHQLRPQAKEKVADDFCEAIEAWIRPHNIVLSPDAQGSIVESITEALDNAERHGWPENEDDLGDWSMAGFCRLKVADNQEVSIHCLFAIVNVGETIDEGLASASPEIRERIDSYTKRHSDGKGRSNAKLRTVMALQDGVTRIAEASENCRGGVGLMELCNVVGELGGAGSGDLDSELCIISGTTCIHIRRPYRTGIAPPDSALRELWFNDANCANDPPDATHVVEMSERFPGAIICARFAIDPSYILRKIAEDESGNHGSDQSV